MATIPAHTTWTRDAYGKIDCHYEAENSVIKMFDVAIWKYKKVLKLKMQHWKYYSLQESVGDTALFLELQHEQSNLTVLQKLRCDVVLGMTDSIN